jgi:hypothetical protein
MSQAQIGNLNVRLGIDTAQFANGLKQAQSSLAGLSGSLKTLAAGAAAGAAAALTGLAFALNNSLKRMDDLGKAAQKVGIPVDEFSKLEYAARLSDVSLDSLTTTLARFSRSLSEISAGGENDAGAALRALGISATDAEGRLRPTSAIIEDVAGKFETMRDGANKTALAVALFGRSGADMIPLLNGGREAIRGAGEELQQFGGVVTPEAARQAEQFNDNLTRLQTAGSGLSQQLASAVLPALVDLAEIMVDLVKNSDFAENAVAILKAGLQQVAMTAATTGKEFYALAQIASVLVENLANPSSLAGAADRWRAAFTNIRAQAAETAEAIARITGGSRFSASQADVDSLLGSIDGKTNAPALPSRQGASAQKLIPPGTIDDIYGAGEAVSVLTENLAAAAPQLSSVAEGLTKIGETISASLSDSIYGLITGTMNVKEAFTSMAESIIRSLADIAAELAASAILRALLGGLSGGAGMLTGGAGISIGGMMFGGVRAAGGPVMSGRSYLVGEEGPELFTPGLSGGITPNHKLGGGQMSVTVNNYAGAEVRTSRGDDGRLQIDILKREIANDLARGGNELSEALQRGYGLRRAGR